MFLYIICTLSILFSSLIHSTQNLDSLYSCDTITLHHTTQHMWVERATKPLFLPKQQLCKISNLEHIEGNLHLSLGAYFEIECATITGTYVIFDENGIGCSRINFTITPYERSTYIDELYTAKEWTGHGLASILLMKAQRASLLLDCPTITLTACPFGHKKTPLKKLTHFYEQFGFHTIAHPAKNEIVMRISPTK